MSGQMSHVSRNDHINVQLNSAAIYSKYTPTHVHKYSLVCESLSTSTYKHTYMCASRPCDIGTYVCSYTEYATQ